MLGAPIPEGVAVEELANIAYRTGMDFIHRLDVPNHKSYGLSKEEILAVVPDGVVKQSETNAKLYSRATSPIPVTENMVANILSDAYDENKR